MIRMEQFDSKVMEHLVLWISLEQFVFKSLSISAELKGDI